MTYTRAQIAHKLRTDERWLARGLLALAQHSPRWHGTDERFFRQLAEQVEEMAIGAEDDPRRYEGTLSAEQEAEAVDRIMRYAGTLTAVANGRA